jgi:lysyl-tRNA synthetase class 1
VANYVQQPNIDLIQKFGELKGSPLTGAEKDILEERVKYAKVWLDSYAPKEDVFEFSEKVPEAAKKLSEKQKEFLLKVIDTLEKETDAEKLQTILYNSSKDAGTKQAFAAIYLSLIGRPSGPKAAWFLLSLPKNKVTERLKEVINL